MTTTAREPRQAPLGAATPLLSVDRLSVRFLLGRGGRRGEVRAVTDASFDLRPGQLLTLVGESGCGKSVLASALLGLLPGNAQLRGTATLSTQDGGRVELLSAPESVLAGRVRGRLVGLVPQSSATHLTPVRTARSQLLEAVRALRPGLDDPAGLVDHLAERVGLEPAVLDRYPHELSGGTAQRVAVALALAGDPPVVLADEPTTGLDRPLVDRTVDLLAGLAEEGRAVLMITHDLAAARGVATDVAVMYASRLVEIGPAGRVFDDPWHPYTAGLLAALPEGGFTPIPGHPPELTALPDGCAFAPRCALLGARDERCTGRPELVRHDDRMVACRRPC
ncbi:peptide/nickel transport system ATP-binding protein [Streptoalloteichus tenebrarius]|uniref:Nickel import system ATP-binding protein NikD n=1 Tax=Streptoalloteichus tenebrarius (strain ATCC 17920 / DSM 40477 / JCM 4838 / CBS 697.72 / NBRC 16177 / NCIMB 11028 / NRRL B-12390 / A12253. 1 / ISP 5477) TaxID=1933 RepID=A0ABT1HNC3_STRSD|nr:ABC transporter ATP-binding protein [Streptoalloteichus tenebrarius]MCP2257005.1 peptide/nickel transport system ATP-binding protein [Streptoalloteichus tenebrarius]BFF00084.1 ABC transporter ATP-binding protein [Streptoalloteichus tenebrarius]